MFSKIISSVALLLFVILVADVSSVSAGSHIHVPNLQHRRHLTNRLANRDNTPKRMVRRRSCSKPGTVIPTPTIGSTKAAEPTKPVSNVGGGSPNNGPTDNLSKPYDNHNNTLFNNPYRGEMTYYGQGLGACGDTYDDNSLTAAVSRHLYDNWPGATKETNRNPICGPYVRGRNILDKTGRFVPVVKDKDSINIGGDGLPNCNPDPKSRCHIPLTATVKHGDKSIIVKIVDRCEGCALGDIDLTPAAFKRLADPSLGRTSVEWHFNQV